MTTGRTPASCAVVPARQRRASASRTKKRQYGRNFGSGAGSSSTRGHQWFRAGTGSGYGDGGIPIHSGAGRVSERDEHAPPPAVLRAPASVVVQLTTAAAMVSSGHARMVDSLGSRGRGAQTSGGPREPSVPGRPHSPATSVSDTGNPTLAYASIAMAGADPPAAPPCSVRQMTQSRWLWIGGHAVVLSSSTCEYRPNDSAAARASMIDPPPQTRAWSARRTTTSERGKRLRALPAGPLRKWRNDM